MYDFRILWTTGVDSFAIAGNSRSINLFNVLLWVLQVLHVFWFIMIMTVAIKSLAHGKVGPFNLNIHLIGTDILC